MKTRKVFITEDDVNISGITDPLPDGLQVVDWLDICHGQKGECVLVRYVPTRCPSRHTYAKNKRPWHVTTVHRRAFSTLEPLSRHGSLAKAVEAARRYAKQRLHQPRARGPRH